MAYGLTDHGFIPKPLEVLLEEARERLESTMGIPAEVLNDSNPLWQLTAIPCSVASELWELGEVLAGSLDPDQASGPQLHALGALTGTDPDEARPSTVTGTLTGTPGTVVGAGHVASVAVTGAAFATLASATIEEVLTWLPSAAVGLDAYRSNENGTFVCVVAGTTGVGVGPRAEDVDLVNGIPLVIDGTATWRYLGPGTGVIEVEMAAVLTGPTVARSGSLNVIDTPVGGWAGVTNLSDAALGQDIEPDEDFRIRRELELASPGTGPLDAIRAELLDVAGVTAVTIFHNNTDVANSDGMPAHSVEAMVQGGEDQDIFDCLLRSVDAGMRTHGTSVGAATDEAGVAHVVKFSRPIEVPIYVAISIVVNASEYPDDGADQIAAVVTAYGDAQAAGKNVTAWGIASKLDEVEGVLDVTYVRISAAPTTAPVASTTIPISLRELAVFDTSRVTVAVLNGVP